MVDADVVAVLVVVEAVDEEKIPIVTTAKEGRITITEFIHQILR